MATIAATHGNWSIIVLRNGLRLDVRFQLSIDKLLHKLAQVVNTACRQEIETTDITGGFTPLMEMCACLSLVTSFVTGCDNIALDRVTLIRVTLIQEDWQAATETGPNLVLATENLGSPLFPTLCTLRRGRYQNGTEPEVIYQVVHEDAISSQLAIASNPNACTALT